MHTLGAVNVFELLDHYEEECRKELARVQKSIDDHPDYARRGMLGYYFHKREQLKKELTRLEAARKSVPVRRAIVAYVAGGVA